MIVHVLDSNAYSQIILYNKLKLIRLACTCTLYVHVSHGKCMQMKICIILCSNKRLRTHIHVYPPGHIWLPPCTKYESAHQTQMMGLHLHVNVLQFNTQVDLRRIVYKKAWYIYL